MSEEAGAAEAPEQLEPTNGDKQEEAETAPAGEEAQAGEAGETSAVEPAGEKGEGGTTEPTNPTAQGAAEAADTVGSLAVGSVNTAEQPGAPDNAADGSLSDQPLVDQGSVRMTAAVPRLDDLIVKCLAENYDIYPALDRIPPEYLDNAVALLDPSQIEFSVAARYIAAEKFWKRLCQERWPICQVANHGMSYKRLYVERHLQSLLEAYYPSTQGQNFERLMKEVNASKPFVHTLNVQQLLSHLDISDILLDFPLLGTLTLKYGARKMGMDYDKSLFGMQLKDAMNMAKLVAKTATLTRLTLCENLLNDESVHILASGLVKNRTLTYLDLSHNKIGDTGAKRIARLLKKEQSVLTHLDLGDNRVHEQGAKVIGQALAVNEVLRHLSLKLNPLSDQGGADVLKHIRDNRALTSLDLCGTNLSTESGKRLASLLEYSSCLTTIDFSCNDGALQGGHALKEALSGNKSLTELDVRRSGCESEVAEDIKSALREKYAAVKRERRQAYQQGWDEAL